MALSKILLIQALYRRHLFVSLLTLPIYLMLNIHDIYLFVTPVFFYSTALLQSLKYSSLELIKFPFQISSLLRETIVISDSLLVDISYPVGLLPNHRIFIKIDQFFGKILQFATSCSISCKTINERNNRNSSFLSSVSDLVIASVYLQLLTMTSGIASVIVIQIHQWKIFA